MSYAYDIVLNFKEDLYDFYEWMKDDSIYHIKRINIVRVDSKIYNEILDNYVKFNDDFMLAIFNKCEYYSNKKIDSLPYAFLLTDSYRVMGLLLNNTGETIKYSSLLLDEEEEILDLCSKLAEIKFDYKIIKKKIKDEFRTRQEINMIKFIKKNLDIDYQNKEFNKLRYLYYEYFNRHSDNIELIYQELIQELDKNINKKHYDLYDLIKLSYSRKNVQN